MQNLKQAHDPWLIYQLAPVGERGSGGRGVPSADPDPVEGEDLPYKVELWDEGKNSVEVVLAVTVSPSIGYAAYFAATREYPTRYVTLRHKTNVVSRWNGPSH